MLLAKTLTLMLAIAVPYKKFVINVYLESSCKRPASVTTVHVLTAVFLLKPERRRKLNTLLANLLADVQWTKTLTASNAELITNVLFAKEDTS